MSWSNYERSMKLAQQCRFYTTEGGKTPDEIKKAEKLLGVQFSKQYKDFCKNYGYLSFYGNEIFGIDPDNLEILEGNCVAYALNDRKVYELPRHYIPIYDYGDGTMAYMDYSALNKEEPRIVIMGYNGSKYHVIEITAEDFGDFVLGLVQDELDG